VFRTSINVINTKHQDDAFDSEGDETLVIEMPHHHHRSRGGRKGASHSSIFPWCCPSFPALTDVVENITGADCVLKFGCKNVDI
jgi:hypothetical protein